VHEQAFRRRHKPRVRVSGTIAKQHKRQVTAEQARGGEDDAFEYGSHVGRRLTNDAQNLGRGGLPGQRLISLAREAPDLCFLAGSRGTARAHTLRGDAPLARCRLSTLRLSGLATCSGPPSLCCPSAQDKASWRDQTSTPRKGSSQLEWG